MPLGITKEESQRITKNIFIKILKKKKKKKKSAFTKSTIAAKI